MVKRIFILPLLLFVFLSGILIFCWFRFGYIYGGGDTGLPTYNPLVMAQIAKNIWWDSLAPGIPVAQGLTSVPLLYFLSIPQVLGASPVFIQAFLFFILLFLMGYGMYLLALNIFGKANFRIATVAGVFYLFNPYMMIQIWHRFIHNSMVLVAFLPFLVLTWLLWIRKRQPLYMILFLVVNFLSVYVFGTIAFIVSFWTLLFLITLLEAVLPWKGKKQALELTFAFFTAVFFWFLTNSWWLLPTFSISPALFATQHTIDDSLSTLISLASQTILPYTLRLINPFYLYWQADFGTIYQGIFFNLISWVFVPIVCIGFIKAVKEKAYAIWSLLLLIVIFLSKGAAAPFSFPYIFGFSHFFPLGVIRNPFEKLGILLPLIYAILFALGLQFLLTILNKYISRPKTYLILVLIFFLHMIFFFPMFTGRLFGSLKRSMLVEVPKSYSKANVWISQDLENTKTKKEGRILHLPLPQSEGVTYHWQYGYSGVEPSAAIFTALPSLARDLGTPQVSDSLAALSLVFHTPYAADQALILKMLQDFNVKYIILHKDIKWLGGELYNPLETEGILDKLEFLEKSVTIGDLAIYKLKDSYFSPKIKLMSNIQYYISPENNTYWPLWLSNENVDLPSFLKPDIKNLPIMEGKELIIVPESVYTYRTQTVFPEKLLEEMPTVRVLPDSPLYPLIRIKEIAQYLSLPPADKFSFKVTLAGKRLVESYLLKQKGSDKSIIPLLREYQQVLPEMKEGVLARVSGKEGTKEISISFILSRHLGTLNLIKEKTINEEKMAAEEVFNKLIDFTKANNVVPNFQIIEAGNLPDVNRVISKFDLHFSDEYELLQAHQQIQDIYPKKLNTNRFQINNELKDSTGSVSGDFISYGKVGLASGLNEISFNSIPSSNLAKITDSAIKGQVQRSNGEIEITSLPHEASYIDINLDPIYGGNWYQLTFDSWIKLGNKFSIKVLQDTDPYDSENPGERLPFYESDFIKDSYINYWHNQKYTFYIHPTTTKAILRILVEPWDGCVYFQPKKSCLNEAFRSRFENLSQVAFRDIKVVRLLTNPVFLKLEFSKPVSTPSGEVNFIQKDAVSYSGSVRVTQPSWLLFKESFDLGWELKLFKNNQIIQPKQHLIANLFANTWFIEKPGEYDFTLQFRPARLIILGLLLAGIGWVMVLIIYVGYNFKRLTFKK